MNYLNAPELVSNNADLGYLSAFYRYMTPIYPSPSVHAVVTHLWEMNSDDEDKGLSHGFGTTINILQGKEECDMNFVSETDKAQKRIDIFLEFNTYFDADYDTNTGCNSQIVPFSYSGGAATPNYWTVDWESDVPKCKLVEWDTEWSLFQYDDYKRCICSSPPSEWGADGEASCPWVEENLQPHGLCTWTETELNVHEVYGFLGMEADSFDLYEMFIE